MQQPILANWNGELMPLDEVRVSVLDRAFFFGDAVYEALRTYAGKPWLCRQHMDRLQRSVKELRIACDVARVEKRMHETIAASGVREGFVYIQVTRGAAPRTHYFPKTPVEPNELIYVQDLQGDPYAGVRETGVRVITHADLRWERRDIKSVNLLGNCLACQAAVEAGCYEAVLIEPSGMVSEGTHTSLFAVKGGCLLTAPNSHHILPGVTRGWVLELARKAGIEISEHAVHRDDLATLDEMFLTGTTSEILAIVELDGRPIGAGKPGPITNRLQETFRREVTRWLESGAGR